MGVLLILAFAAAVLSPLTTATTPSPRNRTVKLGSPVLAAADDGPVPDDEPPVEDDDGEGGGGGDAGTPATVAPTTTMPASHTGMTTAPASTPKATTTKAVATPGVGKALGDGTFLAPYTTSGGVKVFHLTMTAVNWEVSAGHLMEAYTFNGIVPGPVIRINEGDRVRMVVKNDLPISTGVHWHGMILPNEQDGIPGLTQNSIDPGQTYTYNWTAVATGTHWYHSHSSGSDIGRGLYGALEVVPKNGDFKYDRDYRLVIGDTNLGFVINGKSYPYTAPLAARVGERVRIRLVGAGDLSHPFHLHGMTFDVVAQDGIPIKQPQTMDTVLVSAGQTFDLIATPTMPGRWLLHCHIFAHSHMVDTDAAHAMNGSVGSGIAAGMTGLTTTLDVSPSKGSLPEPTTVPVAKAAETAPTIAKAPAATPAVAVTNAAASSGSSNSIVMVAALLLVVLAGIYVAEQRHV